MSYKLIATYGAIHFFSGKKFVGCLKRNPMPSDGTTNWFSSVCNLNTFVDKFFPEQNCETNLSLSELENRLVTPSLGKFEFCILLLATFNDKEDYVCGTLLTLG